MTVRGSSKIPRLRGLEGVRKVMAWYLMLDEMSGTRSHPVVTVVVGSVVQKGQLAPVPVYAHMARITTIPRVPSAPSKRTPPAP